MIVGKSVPRIDAVDKVTGRARYTDDLTDKGAYVAKILHSTISNGVVKRIDISEAEKIKGVVKIVTCFDVPDIKFPTAGHPWSTDPHHQDVMDRHLLTARVRFYGDDVAAVVAENEVAAAQAVRAIKVEYEAYPFVLDQVEAMQDGAPQIHENYPNNILAHTGYENGNYEDAIKEPGLIKFEGWYDTPIVQHCHIENFICEAHMEGDRIVIVASTQIPHIVRRIVGQALSIPWGKVRIIKPYIGGGFGTGIHNTLEAAIFALPIAFGPNYSKFKEARDMVALGAATKVETVTDLEAWFAPLRDNKEYRAKVSSTAKDYTLKNIGATSLIMKIAFDS